MTPSLSQSLLLDQEPAQDLRPTESPILAGISPTQGALGIELDPDLEGEVCAEPHSADLLQDGPEPAPEDRSPEKIPGLAISLEDLAAFEDEKACPDPRLADRIIRATADMSLIQALQPGTKDNQGFNNADFAFGSVLAAAGAVRASALLLMQYRNQAAGHMVSQLDLAWALPDRLFGKVSRSSGMEALRPLREQVRGSIAWVQKGDSVVLVGYGLGWTDKALLKLHGEATAQGWEIRKHDLHRFVTRIQGKVVDREGLVAIGEAHKDRAPKLAPPAASIAVPAVADRKQEVTFTAAKRIYGYDLAWTRPFEPEGQTVKQIVKSLGGRFDGMTKSWILTEDATRMLPTMLEHIPDVDLSSIPMFGDPIPEVLQRRAELMKAGISPVEVVKTTDQAIWIKTPTRNDSVYNALRGMDGVRWDSAAYAYRVENEAVLDVIDRLDSEQSLNLEALTGVAQEIAAEEMRKAEAIRAAVARGVEVPELTPTGRRLFPHQGEAVEFLLKSQLSDPNLRGAILGDDMGLGKSLSALIASYLKEPEGRKLIVCPASLRLNWAKEIQTWLGENERLHTQVLKDGKSNIDPGMRYVIVNYDLLKAHKNAIIAWGPSVAIYDEGHYIKEASAQRSKMVIGETKKQSNGRWEKTEIGIADKVPTNWILTGTPIKNRVKELFNLLQVVGHPLGKDYFKFGVRYCDGRREVINKAGDTRWNFDGASNLDELGEKIKPIYLKRMKTEVLNLPPKIESVVPVELSPKAQKEYKAALKTLLATHRGKDDHFSEEEAGSVLVQINAMKMATAIAKTEAAIEMVRDTLEQGNKIVVFTTYIEILDRFQEEFGSQAVRLDGSMKPEDRQAAVDRFQTDPGVTVFLGSTGACKEGLTLTAAREALFVDMPWVPADFWQASDRIYRIGQTGTCNVRALCADGTFDADLFALIDEKKATVEAFEKAARDGKNVDPEVLAIQHADLRLDIAKRLLKQARKDERAEKKQMGIQG